MLKINNLNVKYGNKIAVDNICLELHDGDIVGYIGTNGSGKTSTIKSIMGLVEYTGDIIINEKSIKGNYEYKRKIGFIPEDIVVFGGFRGNEYIKYVGGLQGISESECMIRSKVFIDYFGMEYIINNKISTYSKGNKQKLAIISSLVHRPEILLLDEPMDGLDPQSIEIYKLILKIHSENGGIVLYSSHVLEVVSNLSNRIIMISNGKIVSDSTLSKLNSEREKDVSLNELFNELTVKVDFEQIENNIRKAYAYGK